MYDPLFGLLQGRGSLPLLTTGAAWLLFNHAVLAPEIAERLAAKDYVPACVEGLEEQDADRLAAHAEKTANARRAFEAKLKAAQDRVKAAQAEIAQKRALAESLIAASPIGELLGAVDLGGTFRGLLDEAMPKVPSAEDLGLTPPNAPPPPVVMSATDKASACVVAAQSVFENNRVSYTLFAASATLYQGDAVRNARVLITEAVEAHHG